MLNIRIAAALGALGVFAFAGSAMAAGGRTFTVVNDNGRYAIEQVWFAHNGEKDDPWHEVELDSPVAPNSTGEIEITGGTSCFYDIKVQFSDGAVQTFTNVNVCRHDRVRAT